ncbi:secreted RxLR effector protein 78-like [Spinacia oleracea]|uniref:Secreted RxLR effector protein 78-like n=1 Tax=Spinacia oleracea TaxID=3562 RepID=A0ABM3RIM7_SPIOL|nr:secreted RxLR effector protein 78-like [Spinacia oleracea]
MRLKNVLPDIITENQSAFVPGRLITDNALIAMVIFHTMKKRSKAQRGVIAMKLDMSKAYDRVEWGFLRKILLTMGFDGRWVNLIMECVSTVSYSFVINGGVSGSVSPSRGLRQGDPLSPYLFILVADAFSRMFQHKVHERKLHRAKASRNGLEISHLLFADDSLLFARAN